MVVSRRRDSKKGSHYTRCLLGHGGRLLGILWEALGQLRPRIGVSSRGTRATLISVSLASMSGIRADQLGYSVEDRCKLVPLPEKKEHRGFLLAKRSQYLSDPKLFAWPNMLPAVAEAVKKDEDGNAFGFFGTYSGTLNPSINHLTNVGPMDRPLWLQEVARSKFMVCRMIQPTMA
jgi:hypothetical protein